MGWFIAGVIAAPILWIMFKVFAAVAIPVEISGRRLLQQELEKLVGTDSSRIPDACLDEFVQCSKEIVELSGGFSRVKFVEDLEGAAGNIAICLGHDSSYQADNQKRYQRSKNLGFCDALDSKGRVVPATAYRRLAKHGVVPALEESTGNGN